MTIMTHAIVVDHNVCVCVCQIGWHFQHFQLIVWPIIDVRAGGFHQNGKSMKPPDSPEERFPLMALDALSFQCLKSHEEKTWANRKSQRNSPPKLSSEVYRSSCVPPSPTQAGSSRASHVHEGGCCFQLPELPQFLVLRLEIAQGDVQGTQALVLGQKSNGENRGENLAKSYDQTWEFLIGNPEGGLPTLENHRAY